jgi:hypothetical protein
MVYIPDGPYAVMESPMSTLTSEDSLKPANATFFVESGAVMQRLRTGISEMLKAIPTKVRTTRDLQKVFGVDVKLCWQVLKLAGPGDALSLAPFVPTPGPMRRFLNAAATAGVDAGVIDQISSAYEAFKEQISIHAGDRPTFEAMATGASGLGEGSSEDLQKAAIRLRKSAFQTTSHYAGVQQDVYLGASFLHPSDKPDRYDSANLRIKLGIRRLRPTANFFVDHTKVVTSDTSIENYQDTFRKGVFDQESNEKYGAPIIADFSSNPLPHFKTMTDVSGRSYSRIVGDNVGQTSAVDLVFGQTVFNVPLTELSVDGEKKIGFGSSLDMTTPTVVVILDKLVHRSTFPKLEVDFSVNWVNNPAFPQSPEHDYPLNFGERLVKLDAGVDGARTYEVPRYIEMLEFVCDRCKWKIEDFDVYRVRVEYPLHYTRMWTKFWSVNAPGT